MLCTENSASAPHLSATDSTQLQAPLLPRGTGTEELRPQEEQTALSPERDPEQPDAVLCDDITPTVKLASFKNVEDLATKIETEWWLCEPLRKYGFGRADLQLEGESSNESGSPFAFMPVIRRASWWSIAMLSANLIVVGIFVLLQIRQLFEVTDSAASNQTSLTMMYSVNEAERPYSTADIGAALAGFSPGLNITEDVLLLINRYLVLGLVTAVLFGNTGAAKPAEAAAQRLSAMNGKPRSQPRPSVTPEDILDTLQADAAAEIKRHAKRHFFYLWAMLALILLGWLPSCLSRAGSVCLPTDLDMWTQISSPYREELAVPMYIIVRSLQYVSIGATALMLRVQCTVHILHARAIILWLRSAQHTVDEAVREFRELATALRGTSHAWSRVLTVQMLIFVTVILTTVGHNFRTGQIDLIHLLLTLWPLQLNVWSIVDVNSFISDIPAKITQKNSSICGNSEIFSAAERDVFANELSRLQLQLRGPGGAVLTSGRLRAMSMSGALFILWTFIKMLMHLQ
eukprot:COSAG02_NODE_6990_length_3244_cov_2.034658_2_plen_517_part_00